MTPTETVAFLRNYNAWRRGNLDDQPMPDPREIGKAIDAAVAMIDRLEAAEKTNRGWLRANATGGWIDNLRIENDTLRAKIDQLEEDTRAALTSNSGAQPAPSVSAELLDRAIDTIGRFCSDEGWMQSDIDTLDALLAASEAKP